MKIKSYMNNTVKSILIPVGIAGVLVGTFFLGVLWQRVQYLENKNGGDVAGANAANPPARPSIPSPIKADTLNLPPITNKDHIKGSKDAKLTWIEYSDLECPFCKQMHPVLQKMLADYDGKVRWVYRHFPLDSLHSKARPEAAAAECASQLGGEDVFWSYIDKVFEVTPANNGLDASQLPKIAIELGLNKTAFQKCLDSGATTQKVKEDSDGGLEAQVNGTPANFLLDERGNAWVISGAVSSLTVAQLMEAALK